MKSFKLLTVFYILATVLSQNLQAVPINIRIVFPYFAPLQVWMLSDFTNWNMYPMAQFVESTYEYHNEINPGVHSLNFRFTGPYDPGTSSYVVTATEGYPRILYTKIYINNQLISSTFVRSDNNISFTLLDNGVVVPLTNPDAGNPIYNDRIPPEVHHPKDSIKTVNGVPGSNYDRVAGWVQVLHDNNFLKESKIEVKSLKLCARVGSETVILDAVDYSVHQFNPLTDGGLYFRYPFFASDTAHSQMSPVSIVNGFLTFRPSDHKDTVWHFWNPAYPLAPTSPNYTSYWFEIIYRISGQACIQTGLDFRDASDSTFEGAVSRWRFESKAGEFDTLIVDTQPLVTSVIGAADATNDLSQVLFDIFPNPFNLFTLVRFRVPALQNVKIILFDVLGQELVTLLDEEIDPGYHEVELTCGKFSSGVYYLRMIAGEYIKTQKLVLLK